MAIQVFGHTAPDSRELLVIRPETGDWGESYALPIGDGMIYNGGGGWLFFCDNGDSLCGYSIGTGQLERILSWTGVGVKSYEVRCVAPLEDGRLLAVTKQFHSAETVVLTPTDPASLPEMTVLTYAALSLDSGTRSKIVEFNKAHPDCRIEFRPEGRGGAERQEGPHCLLPDGPRLPVHQGVNGPSAARTLTEWRKYPPVPCWTRQDSPWRQRAPPVS